MNTSVKWRSRLEARFQELNNRVGDEAEKLSAFRKNEAADLALTSDERAERAELNAIMLALDEAGLEIIPDPVSPETLAHALGLGAEDRANIALTMFLQCYTRWRGPLAGVRNFKGRLFSITS